MTERESKYNAMLDRLSELVQGGDVWGDEEQDLLNFISELRKEVGSCLKRI